MLICLIRDQCFSTKYHLCPLYVVASPSLQFTICFSRYLSQQDYNYEKVNRASLACGPLVKWAIAQLNYAEMLNKVGPLRMELRSLENRAESNQQEAEEVEALIGNLEASIAR